jgi:SAM-dependent methyltransferase
VYWLKRARRLLGRGLFLASVPPARRWLRSRHERGDDIPPVGLVRFGDLRSVEPIGRVGTADRGEGVRGYYARAFVAAQPEAGRGAVLELDATDLSALSSGGSMYDCVVVSSGLEYVDDARVVLRRVHDALRPGGVALIMAGGIARNGRHASVPGLSWHRHFTALSLGRLCGEVFTPERVTVTTYGNVLAAAALLHGLGAAELSAAELDHRDPDYELVIGVRAERQP